MIYSNFKQLGENTRVKNGQQLRRSNAAKPETIYLDTDKEIHITAVDRVGIRLETITLQKLRICRHSFDVFFRTSNYTESQRKKRDYPTDVKSFNFLRLLI